MTAVRSQSTTPEVAVIMAVLDASDTIKVQLEALSRQSMKQPWELIVVDNGCSDDSMQIVERYGSRVPNLRIVRATDARGAAHARNVGARIARAPYLAFCDADDEVGDDWVERITKAVKKDRFVASRFDATRLSTPRGLAARGVGPQQAGLMEFRYVKFLPFAGTCGLAVERDIHVRVGSFDEMMFYLEDCDYCWRVQLTGVPLVFASSALVHIRHRHDPGKSIRQAYNWGQYNVVLLKRYRSKGMPKPHWSTGLRLWWSLLRSLPSARKQAGRDRFMWALGYRLGQLRGSLRHKIFAP